jgi:CheY-like chemotaxis protein/Tfp pilus assembly protein PilF
MHPRKVPTHCAKRSIRMSLPILATPTLHQQGVPQTDLSACRALIIDTNQTSRSILRSMLADLGLSAITQAARINDARKALENQTFDVVLCDYHFDDCQMTGADLLEDLRRAQLLPYATVFVMITGEASYVKVAEAAESALDSYLLKPHNVNTLATRLHMARHRKVVLGSIFEAIEREAFADAAELCLKRFDDKGEYWVYAARIGGELLLRLGRHDEARKLFAAIDETKALPWARLGIARAQLDGGHTQPARRTLESLIAENPTFADAYDVMGRAQLQAGHFDEALDTYKRAADITPASIGRLQKVGMLAFYLGRNDEASRQLDRAASLGVSSKMFDFQSLVMLAQIRFEQKDSKGVQRCLGNLQHSLEKQPTSPRLRRMAAITTVLALMLQRQVAEVVREVKALALDFSQPDFDFEAAGNMLGLITRLSNNELELPDAELWVPQLAARFCISKPSTDLLCMTVAARPAYEDTVRQTYKHVTDLAEKAMSLAKDGSPANGVKALLVQGSKTHNAKLLDLAEMMLQRHKAHISDAGSLGDMVQDMRTKYCRHSAHVQLGASSGRQAGSINLRT